MSCSCGLSLRRVSCPAVACPSFFRVPQAPVFVCLCTGPALAFPFLPNMLWPMLLSLCLQPSVHCSVALPLPSASVLLRFCPGLAWIGLAFSCPVMSRPCLCRILSLPALALSAPLHVLGMASHLKVPVSVPLCKLLSCRCLPWPCLSCAFVLACCPCLALRGIGIALPVHCPCACTSLLPLLFCACSCSWNRRCLCFCDLSCICIAALRFMPGPVKCCHIMFRCPYMPLSRSVRAWPCLDLLLLLTGLGMPFHCHVIVLFVS